MPHRSVWPSPACAPRRASPPGSGVTTLSGGGDPARLALLLQAALARGAHAVISFGIAGGLAPGLAPGTVVVAVPWTTAATRYRDRLGLGRRLAAALPTPRSPTSSASSRPWPDAQDKAALRRRTGAVAVDMESHVAARLAAQHGVPFAALAHRRRPGRTDAAGGRARRHAARRHDGHRRRASLAGASPRQLPALIRTALDASAAFAALKDCRRDLAALFDAGGVGRDGGFAAAGDLDLDAAALRRDAAEFRAG